MFLCFNRYQNHETMTDRRLDREIWVYIFGYVGIRDLSSLSLVNRDFQLWISQHPQCLRRMHKFMELWKRVLYYEDERPIPAPRWIWSHDVAMFHQKMTLLKTKRPCLLYEHHFEDDVNINSPAPDGLPPCMGPYMDT